MSTPQSTKIHNDFMTTKIQSDFMRVFRINNLKNKNGVNKNHQTAYTVAYSYDAGIGRVRYGACKFTKITKHDTFSKDAHRLTAEERYNKYPVYFDICFDSDAPSQILHEVRSCIKKMIFILGMKCRHSNDLAMTTNAIECVVKTQRSVSDATQYTKRKVTLIPQNHSLTPILPSSPSSKKVEWIE
jgi:hypothetical protein